jgi:hypothetical protein
MKMRFVSVTVGFVAVLALAACKSSSSSGTGAGGAATGGTGGTGTGGGGSGAGGSGPDCACACMNTMANGGCADLCDDAQNGNPNTPNYCNMSAALSECSACLMTTCMFTAAEISDTTACQ